MRISRTRLAAAALAVAAGAAAVTVTPGAPAPVSYAAARELPSGMWWRTVTGHVGDCGSRKLTRQHPAVVVGYGPGDLQSVLFCPPRPWSNGTVNPS